MLQPKHEVELWQPRRKLLNKKWSLVVQGTSLFRKLNNFQKEFFASDWTFGHVEATFDRSNEIFLAEGQKLFTQCPKMLKKLTIFSESDVFPSKRSDGNIECSFVNPAKN